MNKAAVVIPAALFAFALWSIIGGIRSMVAQENSNRMHAMLLGCKHISKMEKVEDVLVFDCRGRIELHKQILWTELKTL